MDLTKVGKSWLTKARTWLKDRPKAVAFGVAAGVPLGLLAVGGYIITTAVVLALISVAALGVLLWKMKSANSRIARRIYSIISHHPLATDIGFTVVVYMLSPGGVIGMLGAGVAAVVASGLLMLLPKGEQDEKDTKDSQEPLLEGVDGL